MDELEYVAMTRRLIADFKQSPQKYLTATDITQHLFPDCFPDADREVMQEAVAHLRSNGITPARFIAAIKTRTRDIVKAERQQRAEELRQERQQKSGDAFGGEPTDARDAVWMYCTHNKVQHHYDGTCFQDGKFITSSAIETAILLSAESLGYTFGPAKTMSVNGIKLAFGEYLDATKEERKLAVWERIKTTDPVTAAKALRQLRELCEKMFVEPAFGDAAIRKFIWQVKRKIAGLYIEHLHMLVIQGGQGTGKTELCRNLLLPVNELAAPATVAEILDTRNFTTREMYVAFPDELAKADKQDVNDLKTVISGDYSTARVLYSHRSQRNKINLSLIGTADRSVATIIVDLAGMRRFVEVITKPRHLIKLDWQTEVVEFPWHDLWCAVDHTTADPLMSQFEDMLKAKQEAMRARDNTEAWLESFFYDASSHRPIHKTVPDKYVEFRAEELYINYFRAYEGDYHPSTHGTSLTAWGLRMKGLIDAGRYPRWSYRKAGNLTFYRHELSNIVNMHEDPGTGLAVLKSAIASAKLR